MNAPTNEELIDVVDENDHVVSQVAKQEAHERGLLHRCVIAEVFDQEGKWILVKQSADRQDAGQYVSPVGGHIQAGESEIAALKREAFEELRLTNFAYKYIGKAIYNRFVRNRQENHYFILYEIITDETPKLNHESKSFQRFSVEEIKKELKNHPTIFGDAFHFVMKEFYSSLLLTD